MHRYSLLMAVSLALIGCGPGSPPMMPTWAPREQTYTPSEGSSNAFDAYALIGRNVEETVREPLLSRVYFDPDNREKAISMVQKYIPLLEAATHKTCEFRYTPCPMFAAPPYQRGWRLLGRVLTWNIQKACVAGNYDAAIGYAVAATKFGFDLSGGASTDASLGLEIADDARKAIAPYIARFGAGQLGAYAEGMQQALDRKPPLKVTIEHEHARMLQGVQYIQDAYANERFDELMRNMKEDVRDGVAYLRDLKSQDAKRRPAYFEGFAAEADEQTRWLTLLSEVPQVQRESEPGPRFAKERPWKSFAKQFFTAAVPLLNVEDSTIARTRLAILTANILRQVKSSGAAPKDLSPFNKELTRDPYTGRAFAYRASGPVFDVYSLGEDGIDDAGDTDENFAAPDLRLEQR